MPSTSSGSPPRSLKLAAERLRQVVANDFLRLLTLADARLRTGSARDQQLLDRASVDREVHLLRVGRHRIELDVGRHTGAADRDVARLGEVLRDRELQRRAIRKLGEDELRETLTERSSRR